MSKKINFNIFITIVFFLVLIIISLVLYIGTMKEQKIPNLYGTYQTEQLVELNPTENNSEMGRLQLSFFRDKNKFYKGHSNIYMDEGTFSKDGSLIQNGNIYNIRGKEKEGIVIAEKEYIYYIQDSSVYKLKMVIPAPVILKKDN